MLHYSHPFLRLPLRVDVDQLRREVDQFAPHVWTPDRFQTAIPASYASIPLVSNRGRENDQMSGPFAATPFLSACPYIRQVIAFFDAPVCEVRLRWLGPWSFGHFHFDHTRLVEDRYRVHVPIYTTPRASFYCMDEVVHMSAGSVWTFNRMRRHAVFNDDPCAGRMHLIMDFRESATIRALVDRGTVRTSPELDDALIPFAPNRDAVLEFEDERCPAVWSPERLRSELETLSRRFEPTRFREMSTKTEDFLARWGETWKRHKDSRKGWPTYQKLTREYYAAWSALRPITGPEDDENETNWIGCLLKTGAFVPDQDSRAPSWSPKERCELADMVRIAISGDGAARVSVDGAIWKSIPRTGLRALLEIARGATTTALRRALGRKGFDEAFPTLKWLANEGALCVAGFDRSPSFYVSPRASGSNMEFVVPPATIARLSRIRARLRGIRFRCVNELHFIVQHRGDSAAYLPDAKGYDLLFPDAPAIAQGMALGLSAEEIARELGYEPDDDFLLFVAWLWDLLPFECDREAELRKTTFAQRLAAGETVVLPTFSELNPVAAIRALAMSGSYAIILDSRAHTSADSLRIAATAARIAHIDVLAKTSGRARIADLCEFPVAGFVLSDCDPSVLHDAEAALRSRRGARPFVLALIGTLLGVDTMEDLARSPLIDALAVDVQELSKRAGLAGVDPAKTVARAERRARQFAAREGKLFASQSDRSREGVAILLHGNDDSVLANGVRSLIPDHVRRGSAPRRSADARRG